MQPVPPDPHNANSGFRCREKEALNPKVFKTAEGLLLGLARHSDSDHFHFGALLFPLLLTT